MCRFFNNIFKKTVLHDVSGNTVEVKISVGRVGKDNGD